MFVSGAPLGRLEQQFAPALQLGPGQGLDMAAAHLGVGDNALHQGHGHVSDPFFKHGGCSNLFYAAVHNQHIG